MSAEDVRVDVIDMDSITPPDLAFHRDQRLTSSFQLRLPMVRRPPLLFTWSREPF